MSQLLKIPVRKTGITPTNHNTILCASAKSHVAVCYPAEGNEWFLQSWGFHREVPSWAVELDEMPDIVRISPNAIRLVTVHTSGDLSRVCMWNAQNGRLYAQRKVPPPLDIQFTSDTRFYADYHRYQVSYTVPPLGRGIRYERQNLPLPERLQERRYLVDEMREWVVRGSKRVCWIPPGYIGSVEHSYCWAGSSLVMVGQDGMLRKLTFDGLPEE